MDNLNSDDLCHILYFLDLKNKIKCRSICRRWKGLIDSDFDVTKIVETLVGEDFKSWSSCSSAEHHFSLSLRYISSEISFPNLVSSINSALNHLTTLKLYKCEIHWNDLVKLSESRSWMSGYIDHLEFCHTFLILRNYFNEDSIKVLMKSRGKGFSHLVFIGNNEMGTYTVYRGQTDMFFKKLVEESRAEIEELVCDDSPDLNSFIQALQCDNLKKIEKHSSTGLISSVSASYSAKGNELEQVQIV